MRTIFIGYTAPTLLGEIWAAVSDAGLVAVAFPSAQARFTDWLAQRYAANVEFAPDKVRDALEQLRQYAAGSRRAFTLPLDWSALNDFQKKALKLTFEIPYGETRTYKEIAIALGNPRLARAVGRAEATNPMPLVIPCHRVVGSDQKLHGYGAGSGISTKEWLLRLEKAVLP